MTEVERAVERTLSGGRMPTPRLRAKVAGTGLDRAHPDSAETAEALRS